MTDFPGNARQTKRFLAFVLDEARGALNTSGVAGHVLVETRMTGSTRGGVRTLGCFFPGRADFTSDAVVAERTAQTWATLGKAIDRGNFVPGALCARRIHVYRVRVLTHWTFCTRIPVVHYPRFIGVFCQRIVEVAQETTRVATEYTASRWQHEGPMFGPIESAPMTLVKRVVSGLPKIVPRTTRDQTNTIRIRDQHFTYIGNFGHIPF